jgi:P pilus assembly chaperone PapD
MALAPTRGTAQISVDDLERHLRLGRTSGALSAVIPVRNDEARAQQVVVEVADWYRDSTGANHFTPYGSTAGSCGNRLQVFPTTLQVAPNGLQQVRITYTPAVADTGCWAIVLIRAIQPPPPVPDRQGSFVTIEMQTGVKVYVHRADARPDAVVDTAYTEPVWIPAQDARTASARRDSVAATDGVVRLRNTGTAHLRVRSTVEVRDASGALVRRFDGEEAFLTPASWRAIRYRMPELPAGRYVVVVLLDYGGDEIAAAQFDYDAR